MRSRSNSKEPRIDASFACFRMILRKSPIHRYGVYAAEAIRGRPLGQRAQEFGFRIGLALVLTLMVFATWNDLVHLRIFEIVRGFVT